MAYIIFFPKVETCTSGRNKSFSLRASLAILVFIFLRRDIFSYKLYQCQLGFLKGTIPKSLFFLIDIKFITINEDQIIFK